MWPSQSPCLQHDIGAVVRSRLALQHAASFSFLASRQTHCQPDGETSGSCCHNSHRSYCRALDLWPLGTRRGLLNTPSAAGNTSQVQVLMAMALA